jgi:hypothetical protein
VYFSIVIPNYYIWLFGVHLFYRILDLGLESSMEQQQAAAGSSRAQKIDKI